MLLRRLDIPKRLDLIKSEDIPCPSFSYESLAGLSYLHGLTSYPARAQSARAFSVAAGCWALAVMPICVTPSKLMGPRGQQA